MTFFLKDNSSHSALFETLEFFGECSRLKVNHEKTEIFAPGNSTLQDEDFPKRNICANIKTLGVYFGYNVKQRDALNFRQTLKDTKKSVKGPFSSEILCSRLLLFWNRAIVKWRTLIGRLL